MNVRYLMDDPSSELRQIADVFDLGEIRHVITGVAGTFCQVVGLTTSKSRFVVRVLYPKTTVERLVAVHAVLARLRQDGLLVPEPVRTTSGVTYFERDGSLIEVQRYIAHVEESQHNLVQLRKAFAYLGHLHRAMDAYKLDHLPPPPAYIFRSLAGSISVVDEAEVRLAAMPRLTERTKLSWIYSRTRELLTCLSELRDCAKVEIPSIVIHGDYHLGNIFFQDNSVAAIIDFDMLGWGERLFELAYALYSIDDSTQHVIKRDLYSRDLEVVADLFRQYVTTSGSPLAFQELDLLPAMLARVWLNMIALKGAYSSDPVSGVLAMADDINWCEWLLENKPELCQQLEERLSRPG